MPFSSTFNSRVKPFTRNYRLLILALLTGFAHGSFAQSQLENPVAKKVESGISVISGWHCSAQEIEVFIDVKRVGIAGTGPQRTTTTSQCCHTGSSISLLYH